MAQDAIDQFIAMPKEERGKLFEHLAPEKQHKLLDEIKKRKGNKQVQSSTTSTSPISTGQGEGDWRDKIISHFSPIPEKQYGSHVPLSVGLSNAARGAASGAANLVLHPVQSAWGSAQLAADSLNQMFPDSKLTPQQKKAKDESLQRLKDQWEQFKDNPDYAIGQLAGGILAGRAAGEITGKVAGKLRDTAAKAREGVVRKATGTGPNVTRELVGKTRAANEAEAARVAEKNAAEAEKARGENAKLEAKRKSQVQEHGRKVIESKQSAEEMQNVRDRRVALERGVEHLEPELKTQLESTYEKAKAKVNAPYNELKSALEHHEADPENMAVIRASAEDAIRGVKDIPALLDRFLKQSGKLEYNELQGMREEFGRELRKGTLDSDVYSAYKKVIWGDEDVPESPNKGITGEMEEISRKADAAEQMETGKNPGFEQKLKGARPAYKRYAEVFLDNKSPVSKALETGIQSKPGDFIKSFSGRDEAIQRLAEFDPEMARRLNTVRGYAAESKGIRPSTAKPREVSPLGPKPEPVRPKVIEPKVNKIGTEEITEANRESLAAKEKRLRTGYSPIVSTGLFIDAIRSAMEGRIGHAAMDVAARGVYEIGKQGYAALLRNPNVIKTLTRPTAAQIAEIPVEMRGNIKLLVEEAQRQGVNVNPNISAMVGASASAVVGPKTQSLRKQVEDAREKGSVQ